MAEVITLKVNGESHELLINPGWTLMQVLRDQLGLMGAKPGCVTGNCGSCKVLVDGRAAVSCITTPKSVSGKKIVTIEGLAQDGALDPLQTAFIKHNALQCGFCIPGMIIAGKALLDRNPRPTAHQVEQSLRGNICRCGCYLEIREAIMDCASQRSGI